MSKTVILTFDSDYEADEFINETLISKSIVTHVYTGGYAAVSCYITSVLVDVFSIEGKYDPKWEDKIK